VEIAPETIGSIIGWAAIISIVILMIQIIDLAFYFIRNKDESEGDQST
jgi:hypothetical protein